MFNFLIADKAADMPIEYTEGYSLFAILCCLFGVLLISGAILFTCFIIQEIRKAIKSGKIEKTTKQ